MSRHYDGDRTFIAKAQKRNQKLRTDFTALLILTLKDGFQFSKEQFSTLWAEIRNLDDSIRRKMLFFSDFKSMFREECDLDVQTTYHLTENLKIKTIQEELQLRHLLALVALHTKLGFDKKQLLIFMEIFHKNVDDFTHRRLFITIDKAGRCTFERKTE